MADGLIANPEQVQREIKVAMERLQEMPVALYRQVVWEIFNRILEHTPQYTGKAVANWTLGINSPNLSVEHDVGDPVELTKGGHYPHATRQMGDRYWIEYAQLRFKTLLHRIKRGDKVYISNAVTGNAWKGDGPSSGVPYLAQLQSAAVWSSRLRKANQPYETAMESAWFVVDEYMTSGRIPLGNLESL